MLIQKPSLYSTFDLIVKFVFGNKPQISKYQYATPTDNIQTNANFWLGGQVEEGRIKKVYFSMIK